jgi:hypothetical protein
MLLMTGSSFSVAKMSEAAMIAEATIDANRVLDYTDADLSWLYKSGNPIQIAKDAWNCSW